MEGNRDRSAFRRLRISMGDSWGLLAGAMLLLALLGVLATLQYRWLGQVGEAEAVQLRAGARNRSEQLAREFDRELTRAFLWLGIDAATARSGDGRRYRERWNRWVRFSPEPAIVKGILLVAPDGVRRFSPDTGAFAPTVCPEAMSELCTRTRSIVDPVEAAKPRRSRWSTDPLDGGIPALVAPVLCEVPSSEAAEGPPEQRLDAFTLVELDGEWIRQHFLLELAERHFGRAEKADFGLSISRRAEGSPPHFSFGPQRDEPHDGDVRTGLFDLRFEEMTPADFDGFVFPGGRPRHTGPRPRDESGRWRFVATHRDGSVDVVVASARRRNLAVVGAILTLLAASAVLVVRSAQRARLTANRQLEFVATVSHELRTPLAVICSAGENLADGIVSDAPTVREYGAVVRDEGRRLAGMVERVLDFAGTYSGRRLLHLEPTALVPLLEECERAAAPALREAGLDLTTAYGPNLPPVNVDRRTMRRVVVNLVENAAKHGREGRFLRLSAGADARHVWISVTDKGPGIPADEMGSIFEPFFRGREAVRRQVQGSGLGLCLVDRLVRAQDGRVAVRSVPGEETTFTITLPVGPDEGVA